MNKVHLIVLDGVGYGKKDAGDAFFHAHTPYIDSLLSQHPNTTLKTYGASVGLPEFQTGGSEVGHITLGAGRPVKHLLTKINDQIESGEFFTNPVLVQLHEKAAKLGRIHYMGLLSDGGIHSFQPHLYGLLKMAQSYGIEQVFIHGALDGRDVGERTAREFLRELDTKNGTIASLCGRFYMMDRDQNWDRIEKSYAVLTGKTPSTSSDWQSYLDDYYAHHTESDYYAQPVLLQKEGAMRPDDVLINFNFRTDRMRQISSALCDDEFSLFQRDIQINPNNYGVFGSYYEGAHVVFALGGAQSIQNTFGAVIEHYKKTQLRITETEKFNHVTFFFSGERKEKFEGEDRILLPSPKCPSYAEKPEMSAHAQTEALLESIEHHAYDAVIQNYANGDLVGHSGSFKAAVRAVEVVDECLSKVVPFMKEKGYDILILADHGNCDQMLYENGEVCASHTKNPVPCILISDRYASHHMRDGGTLADVAPTLLTLLGLPIPDEMTGSSLIIDSE